MIEKVIIAEDQEFANLSVQRTMEELQIRQTDYVFYCDDALQKIKIAKGKQEPYDLLITDLYFEEDGTAQKIAGGFDLIKLAREVQPDLPILILSAESRPATIDMLFKQFAINGYVRKARHDAKELKSAVEKLAKGESYYPQALSQMVKQVNTYEFSDFDINIIKLISQGYQQKEISEYLKKHNIRPSSLSTIEKRLNQIREELGFSKNEQLVLFCKEMGIL
ncbi:MAG: response regulator [Chitinophagaceae bacterium]|nr:response regulator [Chitinophagaceae bacterium]